MFDFFQIDDEAKFCAESRFFNALYGKFLGRTPLDVIKTDLLERWKVWGDVTVVDLPNWYFLIQCSSKEVMHNIMFNGSCM